MKKEFEVKATGLPFWSWNDKLEKTKLLKQIRDMRDQGYGGFFMHARAGLETEYLSEEWLDCVAACSAEAKKYGMSPWVYDENGWPSGFAGGKLLQNKKFREHYLTAKQGEYDCRATWNYLIDGENLRLVSKPCGGEFLNVYECESVSTVDVLDDEVTEAFINETHEKYKRYFAGELKEHIDGFFTDEPQYYRGAIPFPHKMRAYFKEKYQEDPCEKLGLLYLKKNGYRDFRYKFRKSCQELFLKNFSKKIYDWCEENGVKITGHYVEERDLYTQMLFNAGIMPYYEYLHYPGIDWLCRRYMPVNCIRQLTSVTAQLKKPMALCETFAMTGWDVTPRELKNIADYQFVYGVNLMCQHLYPYSERGERKHDHPAHFSPYNPWTTRGMIEFNRYFDALGAWLRGSEERVSVAVLCTTRSAYFDFEYGDADNLKALNESLILTCEKLAEDHVPFHLIDETLLEKYGGVSGKKLRLGACEYDTFILPYAHTMDKSTERLLRKYVAAGGAVYLCESAPKYLEGEPYDYHYLHSNISWKEIIKKQSVSVESNGALHTSLRIYRGKPYVFAVNISDREVRAKFTCEGELLAREFCAEADEFLKKDVCDHNGFVKLAPKSAKIFGAGGVGSIENGLKTEQKTTLQTIEIADGEYEIESFGENYLPLDFAQMSLDGVNYGEKLPLIGIFQKLLSMRYEGEVYLKKKFEIREIPSVLKLYSEEKDRMQAYVNGREITLKKAENAAGKDGFFEANILPYVKNGENELIEIYRFHQSEETYYALFGDGVTEGLRNCMRYETFIETVFLSGDFGVFSGNFRNGREKNTRLADSFYIAAAPKKALDFVTEGFPFFAGKMRLKKAFVCENGKKKHSTRLMFSGRYHWADVHINGKFAGSAGFEDFVDVSDLIVAGENVAEIDLYTGNRNLLGPHHIKGAEEELSVSPYSFELNGTWKDGKSEEFTNRYSFVRFGFWGKKE